MATHREETCKFWNKLPDLFSRFYHEEELKEKLSDWLDEYYELLEKYETTKDTKDADIESLSDNGISDTIITIANNKSSITTAIKKLFT